LLSQASGEDAAIEGDATVAQRRAWEQWHRGVGGGSRGGADAWARLQFVCGALDLVERLGGRAPVALDQALGWAELTAAAAAASSTAFAASEDSFTGPTTVGLSGARCYELLARGINRNGASAAQPNYWALWAFVNGTYCNLKSLTDSRGVLASALLEDSGEG
jgi:hypothetical protein